jgi:hypothetical protein
MHWMYFSPFTPIQVNTMEGTIKVKLLNKEVTVGANGLIKSVSVLSQKLRSGLPALSTYNLLSPEGVALELSSGGNLLSLKVQDAATVLSSTASEVQA